MSGYIFLTLFTFVMKLATYFKKTNILLDMLRYRSIF
jgi:hypothetical protein